MNDIKGLVHKIDISHHIIIALGIILLLQCSYLLTVLYVIITTSGMIWFMAKICPHCKAFGTSFCRSRYGVLSSRIFKRPKEIDFRRAFKMNIIAVAVQWFIPFFVGIYRLYISYNLMLLLTFILFIIMAFLWLPLVSRKKGCADCPQRNECAWAYKPEHN